MDKLQFKDMISHYDPNRGDPDGYLQYRAKRRKNGAMSEEKDKDVHENLAWAKDSGWHKPKNTDRFGNTEKDSNTALAHARRIARLTQLKSAKMGQKMGQVVKRSVPAAAKGLGILGLGLEEVEQIDEISLDDLTKSVGASRHLQKVAKVHGSDKLKLELEKMRKRLEKDGKSRSLGWSRPAMATRKESKYYELDSGRMVYDQDIEEASNSVKDQLANIDLSIRDWARRWKNKSAGNPNDMKAPQKIRNLKAQKAALMKKHNIREKVLSTHNNYNYELDEAEIKFVIKHKKTQKVLSTHNNYNGAKDEHSGISDKQNYGIFKQTKKDADLRNRNTYREEVELDEALNMAQRLKRGRTMRRVQKKVQMGRKRSMRRMANLDTLKRRAVKAARKMLLKRLAKGVGKEDLSPARKMELEKKLSTPMMKKRIKMMSMKMLKDVRKRETDRHKNKSSGNE